MNKYENVVIVDPKLDEEALNKLIDRFTKLINKQGKVFSVDNVGLQELAYEIQKNKEAYYVIFTFESDPNFIEELQRNYRITDEILKFLVVRIDEIVVKEKIEKKVEVKDTKVEEVKEVKVETEVAEKEVKVEDKAKAEKETKVEAKEDEKVEVKEEKKAETKETKKEKTEKEDKKAEVKDEVKDDKKEEDIKDKKEK